MQHKAVYYSVDSLYIFRVSTTPIIRSTQNCNYSLRYWSFFFVQLPPSNVAKLNYDSLSSSSASHVGGR